MQGPATAGPFSFLRTAHSMSCAPWLVSGGAVLA